MGRTLVQHHPTFGHIYIPGVRLRIEHEGGGHLFAANQSGFRSNAEFEPRKRPGTFRVLVFGDSYSDAVGVSNEDRYSDVLARMIPGLEVYNFALSGTGTDAQYLIFREVAAQFEHDLLIAGVWVENIIRNTMHYMTHYTPDGEIGIYAKPYFRLHEDGTLELEGVPVPLGPFPPESMSADELSLVYTGHRFARLRQLARRFGPRVKDVLQAVTRFQPLSEYNHADNPPWLLMKAILKRWASESTAPLVIFTIPQYQYTEGKASAAGYQARFRELHDPPRVVVHDPLSHLRRYSRAERRAFRFATDNHPTIAGHRALAESLAPVIRSLMDAQPQLAAPSAAEAVPR